MTTPMTARPWPTRTGWVVGALTVWATAFAISARNVSGDWSFFTAAAHRLFNGDGLHVYVHQTNVQTGPVALVLVRLLDPLGSHALTIAVLVTAVVTIVCLADTIRTRPLGNLTVAIGGAVLLVWWPYLATAGHLDDALVLALGAAAWMLVRRDRPLAAAVLIGVAIACKPWAIVLLPLTLSGTRFRRRDLVGPGVTLAVGAALWSPFVLGDPHTLDELQPAVWMAPDAPLRLFGLGNADITSTLRMVQLIAALAIATLAVRRGRAAGALLVGVAMRMLLDGGTWPYYSVGFVLGALMWDLDADRDRQRVMPWATLCATVLLAPAWVVHDEHMRQLLRFSASLLAITAIALWPNGRPTADFALLGAASPAQDVEPAHR